VYPNLPTSLSGAYVIRSGPGGVDEECQANYVTRLGKPFGIWYDDTTPNLTTEWLPKGVAKYGPLDQTVLVCIPPGEPQLRHRPSPPIVNVQEWYIYGMGVPVSAWGEPPVAEAYCIQWRWPGTEGTEAPTALQRRHLLAQVQVHHPKFIFLF
jgi:hypothetical protein